MLFANGKSFWELMASQEKARPACRKSDCSVTGELLALLVRVTTRMHQMSREHQNVSYSVIASSER